VSPLLEVSDDVEHLVYTNLIHGSEIKVLMNAFTDFLVSSNISNVNRYLYSSSTTVAAGDIALMTFSNLHGSIYADLKISYGPTLPVTATGGTVTVVGGYRIHTFTSSGDFTVTSGGSVEYLIVAGGGGTQSSAGSGGGSGGAGAGGLLTNYTTVTAATYPVIVGGGGSAATNGSNSTFNSITAVGGGYGLQAPGVDGGSGSGVGTGGWTSYSPPGSGIAGQGNDGGTGTGNDSDLATSGGGGGAGAAGGVGTGGIGLQSSISGTATYYAGGGGSGSTDGTQYSGGLGGGGDGKQDGAINTGGGAGGFTPNTGDQNGGSGIVIIRYAI
jgi:hypothetical protein